MVPYEAFLSEKPVVTTTDAGGPLEVVADRRTGGVIAPEATDVAEAAEWLLGHPDEGCVPRAWLATSSPRASPGTGSIERLLA